MTGSYCSRPSLRVAHDGGVERVEVAGERVDEEDALVRLRPRLEAEARLLEQRAHRPLQHRPALAVSAAARVDAQHAHPDACRRELMRHADA